MTAIFYPDCEDSSPNGRFTLEARSPHNGTINHRDGRPPSEDEYGFKYRDHQDHFRYQLIDTHAAALSDSSTRHVIWERWQNQDEDSPHEVVVSDEGWSVIRTHGFRPEVLVVSPEGRDIIRVEIKSPNEGDAEDLDDDEEEPSVPAANVQAWRAVRLQYSTAGMWWSEHSWRYFFRLGDARYFVWRTSWGQKLVIDLGRANILSEAEQMAPAISDAMREEEIQGATSLLAEMAEKMPEIQQLLKNRDSDSEQKNPLLGKLRRVTSAIHLIGVHRVIEAVELLRPWEPIDYPRYSTSSPGMSDGWSVKSQFFRPILHHSLRLLGKEPQGYPAFNFIKDRNRFPLPEFVPDRRDRAFMLTQSMDAKGILQLLGSPDHVRKEAHQVGKRNYYRWTEDWDYDFLVDGQWLTLRIAWEEGEPTGRIAQIREMPSPWLDSDEREEDILRH